MADEHQAIQILRLIFEIIWTVFAVNVEIVKAVIKWFIPPELKDVTGEIVLITGAGHGIGRELALRFGRLGAIVVCVDINPKGNAETVQMIEAGKGKAYKYECDVTDRTAVLQLGDKVRRDVGEVTILINNAGIMPCKPFFKQTEKEIRLMMDLNVNAHFWTLEAFLPSMIERNHGHIVALSSMCGKLGVRNLVPYCGSKFAVRGYMQALAVELHEDPRDTNGIKLTTIFPIMVNTGLCQKPRARFQFLNQMEVSDAVDYMMEAIRREYYEQTVPSYLYYYLKYVVDVVPTSAATILNDFIATGVDAHE